MSMLLPVLLVMPLGLAAAATLAGFLYAVELRDAAELCAAELDAGSGARGVEHLGSPTPPVPGPPAAAASNDERGLAPRD